MTFSCLSIFRKLSTKVISLSNSVNDREGGVIVSWPPEFRGFGWKLMEEWKVLALVSGIPDEYASFSHATLSFDARTWNSL